MRAAMRAADSRGTTLAEAIHSLHERDEYGRPAWQGEPPVRPTPFVLGGIETYRVLERLWPEIRPRRGRCHIFREPLCRACEARRR